MSIFNLKYELCSFNDKLLSFIFHISLLMSVKYAQRWGEKRTLRMKIFRGEAKLKCDDLIGQSSKISLVALYNDQRKSYRASCALLMLHDFTLSCLEDIQEYLASFRLQNDLLLCHDLIYVSDQDQI